MVFDEIIDGFGLSASSSTNLELSCIFEISINSNGLFCSGVAEGAINTQESTNGGLSCSGSVANGYLFQESTNGGALCSGSSNVNSIQTRGLYVTGLNDYGQVGDNTTTNRYKLQLIDSTFEKFSTGLRHCLAINKNNELYAWGQNLNGRLGDGTQTDRYVPTKIGSANDWEQVIASWNFSLAINSSGEMYSWGNNIAGNLGYEPRTDVLTPTKIGTITTFKVTVNSGVNAFGSGNKFYLNGKVSPSITLKEGRTYVFDQSDVSNFGHPLKLSITSNGTHNSGIEFATGVTNFGTPGTNGSYIQIVVPIGVADLYYYCQNHSGMGNSLPTIINLGDGWVKASAGRHVMAINSSGELYAWGENEFGQLADGLSGGVNSRSAPTKIGTATNWTEVAAGYDHTLAINSLGELWSCGRNDYGQLGDGTQTDRSSLVQVGSSTNWIAVAAGRDHSLALNSDGEIYSWGRNQSGYYQLGLGDVTESVRTSPTKIGSSTNWKSVKVGFQHSVALNTDNEIYGFGYNGYGCLGDGTTGSRSSPVLIASIENVRNIEAGGYLTLSFVFSNIIEIGSGGIRSSGFSWYSSGVPIDGGTLLSGTADATIVLNPSETNPVLAGGFAEVYLIGSKEISSNGIVCSGDSEFGTTVTEAASGGVSIAGKSVLGISIVASGGSSAGGSSAMSKVMTVASNCSAIVGGESRFFLRITENALGGFSASGKGVIGIQPKVGGTILASGSSPELKLSLPEVGIGSALVGQETSIVTAIYNIEKYKRGQARLSGRARKERLRPLIKSILHNVGLCLETPNILNAPPVDKNKIIVPKTAVAPELDPNSFRIRHYPGWCEFGDTCASAYVSDVVKKRQGKYMPEKVSKEVVQPGIQLAKKS